MSRAHCSAMSLTSLRFLSPNGWVMTAIGRSGLPSAFAWDRPKVRKAVEQTVTAARPRFATSTLSWTLHDAHEPQSPEPAMTTSHSSASSRTISSGAGREADVFLRLITCRTP